MSAPIASTASSSQPLPSSSAAFRSSSPPRNMRAHSPARAQSKTVAVLGASYGGTRAAQVLAQTLPDGWRVVLVDRNSHGNHLYVLPRFAVVPGHEHKAFIPLTNLFYHKSPTPAPAAHPHRLLHATVTALSPHAVTLARPAPTFTAYATGSGRTSPVPADDDGADCPDHVHAGAVNSGEDHTDIAGPSCLPFDYAIYALGSRLPAPIDIWATPRGSAPTERAEAAVLADADAADGADATPTPTKRGTKAEGVEWLRRCQERVRAARSVLVVGGGALGIQFASDIASLYPEKKVTLLHSRAHLLPRFDEALSSEVLSSLTALDVTVLLNQRLDLASLASATPTKPSAPVPGASDAPAERTVRTVSGREIRAELVLLCTGQTPNTALLAAALPDAIVPDGPDRGLVRVLRTLQVAVPASDDELAAAAAAQEVACVEPAALASPVVADVREGTADPVLSAALASRTSSPAPSESSLSSDGTDELAAEPTDDAHLRTPHAHLFCVGDAADAFGALKAGHTAYWQAEVAARNIVRLVRADEARAALAQRGAELGVEEAARLEDVVAEGGRLEKYVPGEPAVKVSLGLDKSAYQVNGAVGTKVEARQDLDIELMWGFWGHPGVDEAGMHA